MIIKSNYNPQLRIYQAIQLTQNNNEQNLNSDKNQEDKVVEQAVQQSGKQTIKIQLEQQLFEHVKGFDENVETQFYTNRKCNDLQFDNNQNTIIEVFYVHSPFEKEKSSYKLSYIQQQTNNFNISEQKRIELFSGGEEELNIDIFDEENLTFKEQTLEFQHHKKYLNIQCKNNGSSVSIFGQQVNHVQVMVYEFRVEFLKFLEEGEKKCQLGYFSDTMESTEDKFIELKKLDDSFCQKVKFKKQQIAQKILPMGATEYYIPLDNNGFSNDQKFLKSYEDELEKKIKNEWKLDQPKISQVSTIPLSDASNVDIKVNNDCVDISVANDVQLSCCQEPNPTNQLPCILYGTVDEEKIVYKSLQVFDFQIENFNYQVKYKNEEGIKFRKDSSTLGKMDFLSLFAKGKTLKDYLSNFAEVIVNVTSDQIQVFLIKKSSVKNHEFKILDLSKENVNYLSAEQSDKEKYEYYKHEENIYQSLIIPPKTEDIFSVSFLQPDGKIVQQKTEIEQISKTIYFFNYDNNIKDIKQIHSIVWIDCDPQDKKKCSIKKIETLLFTQDDLDEIEVINMIKKQTEKGTYQYDFVLLKIIIDQSQLVNKHYSIEMPNGIDDVFCFFENRKFNNEFVQNFSQPIMYGIELKEKYYVKSFNPNFFLIYEKHDDFSYISLKAMVQASVIKPQGQNDVRISKNYEQVSIGTKVFNYQNQLLTIKDEAEHKNIHFFMIQNLEGIEFINKDHFEVNILRAGKKFMGIFI